MGEVAKRKVIWLDTETAGLRPEKHGLIQLACIVEIDGIEQGRFQSYVRPFPGDMISAKALEVSGTTREALETYPYPQQVLLEFRRFMMDYVDPFKTKDKFRAAGYNVEFDLMFLEEFFLKNEDQFFYSFVTHKYIDVLAVIQYFDFRGLITGLSNCKLGTVCKELDIDVAFDDMHNALADVEATRALASWIDDFISSGAAPLSIPALPRKEG